MADKDDSSWKRCSTCRGPIDFGTTYYVCSVSTCNRKRTTYRFCTVECWEEHLPLMRHREAGAVEEIAPTRAAWQQQAESESSAARPTGSGSGSGSPKRDAPRRRIVGASPKPVPEETGEVLVVVSRFKNHVRERFGMNTSDAVMEAVSNHLRAICHQAVQSAREDGRKTLMDRDFEFLRRR